MDFLKRTYAVICKIETAICAGSLIAMTALVFLGGVTRFLGHPMNWANDIALFLFAWGSLLSADIGIRQNRIINVDFLTSKFSLKVQKWLAIFWSFVIIALLIFLIVYGIPLCIENSKRQFQNITLSYSYVTASLPVSAFLMIISMGLKIKKQIKDFPSTLHSVSRDVV